METRRFSSIWVRFARFTAFANGREGTEEREKKTEVGEGCKKGGSVSARILISSPRPMVPRCISRLRPAFAFRRTTQFRRSLFRINA